MPFEVWGTFSVIDHLCEKPLVAEILLFDKLVIPVVPSQSPEEFERWQKNEWYPEKQEELLNKITTINPNIIWPVPWNKVNQNQFDSESRLEAARAVAFDADNIARIQADYPGRDIYRETRFILQDWSKNPENWPDPQPGVWVEAMAAYPSYSQFRSDVPVDQFSKNKSNFEDGLAAIFGWEFLVPDPKKIDDIKLVQIAAQLASDSSFKKKRKAFHDWRRNILKHGIPEKSAIEEMEDLIHEYNDIVRKSSIRNRTINCFAIAEISAGVAASLGCSTAGVGGALIGLVHWGVEKWFPDYERRFSELRPSAMFYDIRKKFNLY